MTQTTRRRIVGNDPARFDAKVDRDGPVSELVGTRCWLWTTSVRTGYGQFWLATEGRPVPAHRFSFELHVGPIPNGLDLDHLCRVRACVNPAHLEPVSRSENVTRALPFSEIRGDSSRCKRNHEIAGANILIWNDGRRRCRECEALRRARRRSQ